jgi:hypothetical protein
MSADMQHPREEDLLDKVEGIISDSDFIENDRRRAAPLSI